MTVGGAALLAFLVFPVACTDRPTTPSALFAADLPAASGTACPRAISMVICWKSGTPTKCNKRISRTLCTDALSESLPEITNS